MIPGARRRSRCGDRGSAESGTASSAATRWAPTPRWPTRCGIPGARRAGRHRSRLHGQTRDECVGVLGRAGRGAGERGGSTASSSTSTASRGLTPPGATRCCASPANGCSATAISMPSLEALREVPRSRPFERLDDLEGDRGARARRRQPRRGGPGPSACGRDAYAEACRGRELVGEERGNRRSPGRGAGCPAISPPTLRSGALFMGYNA